MAIRRASEPRERRDRQVARRLSQQFDKAYKRAVRAPAHQGLCRWEHGDAWVGKLLRVYWAGVSPPHRRPPRARCAGLGPWSLIFERKFSRAAADDHGWYDGEVAAYRRDKGRHMYEVAGSPAAGPPHTE